MYKKDGGSTFIPQAVLFAARRKTAAEVELWMWLKLRAIAVHTFL